jgi:hypothetical protein
MNFLRNHWYDVGGFLTIILFAFLLSAHRNLTAYQELMWVHLISLLLHQLEEYRFPGSFPGMVNSVMYQSKMPDRYPLNTNTAFFINVVLGWTAYFLAALFAGSTVWPGMATIIVSIGNIIVHSFVFNIRGKTTYNAGMLTSLFLFLPCTCLFFYIIHVQHLVTWVDYAIGIPLGILFAVIGIRKMIEWMADEQTTYIFDKRNVLPEEKT